MTSQTATISLTPSAGRAHLAKDHPAFQRTEAFIEEQVSKCRPSAIKLATETILKRGFGLTETNLLQKVAEQVDVMEVRMAKRLRRYYGLGGKYVGH